MIGQTVSHYRILEKLGEGGMGVVYKAQDEKLNRPVALKFLPHHVSASEMEKNRFLQEAQAAATLNHPNICVIHDIKEEEGPKGTSHQFIVMEFVDGTTLRNKFETEPLKISDAITYGIQIGEALQEAHSKGIVHRDIKADNIMVNSKNQIKVMDFGLAKLKGSLKLTRSSSTVGTLAYMAPEQIQGGEVDLRSDIFSFGVVLFEMVTGRTPFRGEHEAAIVYSIANEEPERLDKYRPDAPQDLQHIISACLEKDPQDRYQSMGEIIRELRRIQKQSSRVSRHSGVQRPILEPDQPTEAPSSGEMPAVPRRVPKRTIWLGAVGVTVLLLVSLYFLFVHKSAPELNPNMTFRVLQIPFTQIFYPGISPDGNWVAFPAADANRKWDVYFMNTAGGEPRRITNDSSAFVGQTDISPDGSQIVFEQVSPPTFDRNVYVVSSLGGLSRRVAEKGFVARWRPDGERIGYVKIPTQSESKKFEFWSVKPAGGDERKEYVDTVSVRGGRFSISWSPDGKKLAWLRSFKPTHQEVFVIELENGRERQLTFHGKTIDEVCWTPQNEIVYSSNKGGNTNLWVVSANGGESRQLTKGGGPDIGIKISADGKRLLYLQQQQVGYLWSSDLDGSNARQITFDERGVFAPTLSPDGKQILLAAADPDPLSRAAHINLMDRDGSNRKHITSGEAFHASPQWSPDGKQILYSSRLVSEPADSAKLYIVDVANLGAPRFLAKGQGGRWVSQKKLILHRDRRPYIYDLESETEKPLLVDSTSVMGYKEGRYVLFFDAHRGQDGIWILPAQEAEKGTIEGAKKFLSTKDILLGNVSPDATFILFMQKRGELWKMSVPDGKKERMKSSLPEVGITINADGKGLLYVDFRLSSKLVLIENMYK